MKKSLMIYSLALSLAIIGLTGVAFAHWTKTITVTGMVTTGSVEWEWELPQSPGHTGDYGEDWSRDPYDPTNVNLAFPTYKDVAQATISRSTDKKTLTISVRNAYPMYAINPTFHPHYTGKTPGMVQWLRMYRIYRDQYGDIITKEFIKEITVKARFYIGEWRVIEGQRVWVDLFQIDWKDDVVQQMEYCESDEWSFYLVCLEPIEQEASYEFWFEAQVINYNEYDEYCPSIPYVPPYEPPK